MNRIIITNHQLTVITTAYVCGSATLLISSSAVGLALQDAWISTLIATIAGLLILLLNSYLGGLFPDKTIIEVIQLLLGKWLGGFIAANFILLSLIGATQYVWYIGDFFTSKYMTDTPSYAINILFTAVIVIALLYGLEAIGRASEVFYFIFFPLFILAMLMLTPNIDIENLLPVLENGITPVLKGAMPIIGISVFPLILLNMIFPSNIKDFKKAKKPMILGFLLGMLITFLSITMCILVLGSPLTAVLRFPVFSLTKEIDIGMVLTRIEALLIFAWLLTIFNNTLIYFYSGIVGLSQFLKLKDYKIIVLPIGLLTAVFSNFIYNNVPYEINWDTIVWFPYIGTFGFVLPVILLVMALIRKRRSLK